MGLEVSRLARNNADWHRLLEICALANTLILDEDGVYDPTGRLLRAPAGSERYVSTLVSGDVEWRATRRLLFTLVYTHVFPGEFVRDTGSHHDIDFVELTGRLRF